jgi:hypothetical protein
LAVYLDWDNTQATVPASEKLSLQLLDGAGRLVAQTDRPFSLREYVGGVACYAITLPQALPQGDYRLILALYDPDHAGARLRTSDGADAVEVAHLQAR